jgi:integrase
MAETGVRIDEALSIRIEDITCDNTRMVDALNVRVTVSGRVWKLWISRSKTATRHVWAYHSTTSLYAWLLDHPVKSGALFVGRRHLGQFMPLTYSGAYQMITAAYVAAGYQDERVVKSLKITAAKNTQDPELEKLLAAELAKPPIPGRRIHVFRHSAATQMVRERVNPKIMCRALGWTQGSNAPDVYIHLTEEDVETEMLRRFGLDGQEEKKVPGIESWRCPICGTMNPPTSGICMNCPPKPVNDQVQALQERIDELESAQLKRNKELAEMMRDLIRDMKEKKRPE